ncbi:MAG: hypothetical protein ACRC0G_01840 [Fusobacteriaceae bacterium]
MKLIFISFLILTFNLSAYVNINPVKFDKNIDGKGSVEEYTLYNPTQNSLKYELYLTDEGIERSMKNWIELYPKSITLKPGFSSKFKVFIKAPKGAPNGEYLATVGIKEVGLPNMKDRKSSTLQILTHLKIDLAGFIGELTPKIFLKDFEFNLKEEELIFKGFIANIGNRRGTLDFYLSQNRGKDSIYLGNIRLLKNEKIDASKLNQKLTSDDREILKNISRYNTLIIKDSVNNKILHEEKIK